MKELLTELIEQFLTEMIHFIWLVMRDVPFHL